MSAEPNRTSRAVWLLIVGLASLQPLIHALILYAPPTGTASTGLSIPDSALFFESMDMFPSGFASPYATCQADAGEQSLVYYSVPHLWLYGVLGLVHKLLLINRFLFYGFANGLGALFYLWVVYRFLRYIVPRQANVAFVLFSLGGGPGGVLYLLTGAFGLHQLPAFETYFFRFAVYDLMEGPHFNPVLYFPRLYYTLSLACCLGGLTALIRMHRTPAFDIPWGWLFALLVGTFLNARYGVYTGGLLVLYLACQETLEKRASFRTLAASAVPIGIGFFIAFMLMRLNPAVLENHLVVGSMAMWFSPFVIVTALPFVIGVRFISRRASHSKVRLVRVLIPCGLGYLLAYGVGYVLYQGYYGNLWTGRDGSVAAVVSDWALLGALAGAAWGWRKATYENNDSSHLDWIILWFLGFAALSISGFGQGWFLHFGPQRLQVLLWLPLSIIVAQGLTSFRPALRRVLLVTLLGFGICSIAVATFCFQTPLGRSQAVGTWPELHPEIMTEADTQLLEALGAGTVLAPIPASDVVVRQRGNPVVFGIGSFNLTDQPYVELRAATTTFFAPDTSDTVRREIASLWCVDWVYAPDTWPVDPQTRKALDEASWLERIASEGAGSVYRVRNGEIE